MKEIIEETVRIKYTCSNEQCDNSIIVKSHKEPHEVTSDWVTYRTGDDIFFKGGLVVDLDVYAEIERTLHCCCDGCFKMAVEQRIKKALEIFNEL